MNTLVRIVEDPDVVPGCFKSGGARVVSGLTDEELGRELRTQEVRCHGPEEAEQLRESIARLGFEETP